MDEAVARLNIEHFRKRLAEERDESKRTTLRQLLAEEEAKLEAILRRDRGATNDSSRTDPVRTNPASELDAHKRARRSQT